MNGATKISIPRAGFVGLWGEFCNDNHAFMPYGELDRLAKELDKNGSATHNAHTAGQFMFEVVKE